MLASRSGGGAASAADPKYRWLPLRPLRRHQSRLLLGAVLAPSHFLSARHCLNSVPRSTSDCKAATIELHVATRQCGFRRAFDGNELPFTASDRPPRSVSATARDGDRQCATANSEGMCLCLPFGGGRKRVSRIAVYFLKLRDQPELKTHPSFLSDLFAFVP